MTLIKICGNKKRLFFSITISCTPINRLRSTVILGYSFNYPVAFKASVQRFIKVFFRQSSRQISMWI